jgi:hypothetical protein
MNGSIARTKAMEPRQAVKRPVRVGVFAGIGPADAAITRLLHDGFTRAQITVVAPKLFRDHFGREHLDAKQPGGSRAFKAATIGGVLGAVLGGVLAATAVAWTGGTALKITAMVVAGAVVGVMAGGFIGAMMSRGFEKETTDFYDQALQEGKILVGVEYAGSDQRSKLELAERDLAEAGAEALSLRKG